MQISKKIYCFPILHLILGKVTKFLAEKLSTSEVISTGRGGKHPLPLVCNGTVKNTKTRDQTSKTETLIYILYIRHNKIGRSSVFPRDPDDTIIRKINSIRYVKGSCFHFLGS